MIQLSFKDKADLVEKMDNGDIQNSIYEYLCEIVYDQTNYEGMYNEKLDKENVYSYFEAKIDETFISSEEILNSTNGLSATLHYIINNVYKRFVEDANLLTKKNNIISGLCDFQEDIGFYYEAYKLNMLNDDDIKEIVKYSFELYEKVKDVRL